MEVEEENNITNNEPTQAERFKYDQSLFKADFAETVSTEESYSYLMNLDYDDDKIMLQNRVNKQTSHKHIRNRSYVFKDNFKQEKIQEDNVESTVSSNLKVKATIPIKQWVFSIGKTDRKSSGKSSYGVGFFDGSFAMYSAENELIGQTSNLAKEPIRILKFFNKYSNERIDSHVLMTNASSNKIQISRVTKSANELLTVNQLALCEGHHDSIESVDLNPESDDRLCSGGNDQCLGIWRLKDKQFDSVFNNVSIRVAENPLKRVKLCGVKIKPEWLKQLHNQPISKTVWAKDQAIYSSSLDGVVKIFDPYTVKETGSFTTKFKPPTAMTYKNNLLALGTEDGIITVFDERINHQNSIPIINGHIKPISDLKFHPSDSNILLSASHDSYIKIWDLRTLFPSTTIGDTKRKLIVADWNGDKDFLVGGSDSKITVYQYGHD